MRPDLLWRSSLWLLLASGSALAADAGVISAVALPREFWLYYAEFADERGELLDPLEFSEVSRLPRGRGAEPSQREPTSAPVQHEEESNESGN